MKTIKSLEYYLSLPYTLEVVPDVEQGGWIVKVPLLQGCMSDGDTWDEVLTMITEAKGLWLEVAVEDNMRIPEPASVEVEDLQVS